MSKKVAILGAAGTLGACSAFTLATQGFCDEIILIPHRRENLVKLYQIDLEGAVSGMNETKVWVGSKADLREADVVLVCAGAPWRQISSRMELLEDSLPVAQEVAEILGQYARLDAVVINMTNPLDPTNWLLQRLSGLARERILGYAFNDTIRFRRLLANHLGVPATAVDASVIGEHGSHQVLLFSSVRVNGVPVAVSEKIRSEIVAEIPRIIPRLEALGQGRTVGWTCSIGVAAQVRAVLEDTGESFPCSVVLSGEYGRQNLSATVPVRLGRGGVQGFPPMELEAGEQAQLESCFDFLEATVRPLEQRYPQTRSTASVSR
jgi:malate/lactate dehydrogenase